MAVLLVVLGGGILQPKGDGSSSGQEVWRALIRKLGVASGFVLGAIGGAALAVVVAPEAGERTRERAAQWLRRICPGAVGCIGERATGAAVGGPTVEEGLLPDERVTQAVREELERRGLLCRGLDVNTVDGVVFLRGRVDDPSTIEEILSVTRSAVGVADVVDEVQRQ